MKTLRLLLLRTCALPIGTRVCARAPISVVLMSALLLPCGTSIAVSDPCPEHLLVIERSKNANIVVYDAEREPSGDLVASKPVVAYWLLNGEKGKREELNVVQWQSAYGFDVKRGNTPGTFVMAFKVDRKRPLTVRIRGHCPVLIGRIDGRDGILHKMYVRSNESSTPPKVEYVEFFGEDTETGKPLHERSVPSK